MGNDLKERLLKAVEGLSKNEALDFLDRYKDSIKYKSAHKGRQPTHIKRTIEKVIEKMK